MIFVEKNLNIINKVANFTELLFAVIIIMYVFLVKFLNFMNLISEYKHCPGRFGPELELYHKERWCGYCQGIKCKCIMSSEYKCSSVIQPCSYGKSVIPFETSLFH